MASLLSDLITNHSSTVAAHPLFVGFGTAALGSLCHDVVLQALEAGFRHFDTAEEHEHWYHPAAVGTALQAYAESLMSYSNDSNVAEDDECVMFDDEDSGNGASTCLGRSAARQRFCQELHISTKIPPWELTSMEHIRSNAAQSRAQLVGCCDDDDEKFPLDIYYIHAPACWKGWHPRCDDAPKTLDLRSVWLALEAVVGLDHSARRIGLSNVRPDELLDIIQFVRERATLEPDPTVAPPRMPDAVQSFADPIEPAEELRKICRDHGIQFVSYSTLGTQHIYRSKLQENPVLTHPIVLELAEQYQRSTAEVVLSWALQHHMSVIPRSSRREHIWELARLLPAAPEERVQGFLDAADLTRMDLLKNIL